MGEAFDDESGFCPPSVLEDEDWDVELFGNNTLNGSPDFVEVVSDVHHWHVQVC